MRSNGFSVLSGQVILITGKPCKAEVAGPPLSPNRSYSTFITSHHYHLHHHHKVGHTYSGVGPENKSRPAD
ncbi:hypothetical protein BDV11DRAFT_186365 [Aspergillus similis]